MASKVIHAGGGPQPNSKRPGTSYLLVNGVIVDCARERLVEDAAVWVREGVIQDSGPKTKVLATLEAEGVTCHAVDMNERFLLPGLIDCHTHFGVTHPGTDDVAHFGAETAIDLAFRMAANAGAALEAGVTTVRLLGERGHVDLALRSAIDRGLVTGPRIITAARSLTTTGGHGEGVDSIRLDGRSEFRRAARAQLEAGAEWIKVMVSGGVSDDATVGRAQHLFLDEVAEVVDVANAWGQRVAAHAGTADSVTLSLEAGVHSIEHGYQLDDRHVSHMAEAGVWLVPTMLVTRSTDFFTRLGASPATIARIEATREEHDDSVARALAAGVTIAMGTDFLPHETFEGAPAAVRELECMVDAGMTPVAALQSATTEAARLLRMESMVGSLDAGMKADILATRNNPLEDVSALRSLEFVVANGTLVRDDRDAVLQMTSSSEL